MQIRIDVAIHVAIGELVGSAPKLGARHRDHCYQDRYPPNKMKLKKKYDRRVSLAVIDTTFRAYGENGIIISASIAGEHLARHKVELFNGSRHVYVRDCVLIVLNVPINACT